VNEKALVEHGIQCGNKVVAGTETYTTASLVSYGGREYAVNPHAMLTINCTARCNAKCFFCYNHLTFMRDSDYVEAGTPALRRVINFAKSAGIRIAALSGGEPSLCPDKLLALVRQLKESRFEIIRMHTNGIGLGRAVPYEDCTLPLWRQLERAGLNDLSVSLADFRKEQNQRIMGIDSATSLRTLLPDMAGSSLNLRLSCYLCREGIWEIEEINQYIQFGRKNGVHNFIFRLSPKHQEEDRRYLRVLLDWLYANKWGMVYSHEKSDSWVYDLRRGENCLSISYASEETDRDRKIRRLIYMPDQIVYTSWIDPASYLFEEDREKLISAALREGLLKSVPDYVFQNQGQTIDLHLHSLVSDGLCTPTEVLCRAAEAGLKKVVFTEHNCLHDAPELLIQAGAELGVEISAFGVEFSTVYVQDGHPRLKFHLLVYAQSAKQLDFLNKLYNPNKPRNQYLRMLYERAMQDDLIDVSWEKIYAIKDPRAPTRKKMFVRTPLAQAIANHLGITVEEAKERYLPQIPDELRYQNYLDTAQIIALAHENGAVAVLAHPGWIRSYDKSEVAGERELFLAIADLARKGLDGIEVSHRQNTPEMREKLYCLAKALGLVPVGGSDFHGKPRCELGVNGTTKENMKRLFDRMV